MATAKEKPGLTSGTAKGAPDKDDDSAVKRTADLSEQVLRHVESGQRGAVGAVRNFIGSIRGEASSAGDGGKRREVIDSTLEMTDRLVQVEYEFVRKVVHSAGESLSPPRGSR